MTTLVRQVAAKDCGFACLAMLTGRTLDEAWDLFESVYPGARESERLRRDGVTNVELDAVLAQAGFATARRWCGGRLQRPKPEPFADVHLGEVLLHNGGHFVVVLRDGAVLDPAGHFTRWDQFREVMALAAVVPVPAQAAA